MPAANLDQELVDFHTRFPTVRRLRCLSCGSDNPEGMKFCGECGAPLKNHCPNCGFENPPVSATRELAEAVMALSREHGFAQRVATGTILRGWALAERCPEPTERYGQEPEGIAHMRQGLEAFRAPGTEIGWPHYLALLAAVYMMRGQAEAGLSVVDEALTAGDTHGERFYEAELYRLKGELQLELSAANHTGAESYFRQALDISHRQDAKSLELRAAMSLGRLWQQQGKHAQARQLLAPVYDWFTEGFDTADLREARALLDDLA